MHKIRNEVCSMTRKEMKEVVKDLLINNIIYDSYVDYDGNAITEIDYDKTVDGIVNNIEDFVIY